MIWVLYVRKKQKSQKTVSDEEKKILKKRSTLTSVLLCIVFSYIYVSKSNVADCVRITLLGVLYILGNKRSTAGEDSI